MPTGNEAARPAVLSVVIPAHNEEHVIGRCLTPLRELGESGVLEVAVVCNGCTDDTAEVARIAAPWATVVEIPEASKPAALNLGDQIVSVYPRAYVDADVEVPASSALELARVLESGEALAAAPRLRTDISASPYPVRAFVRVWSELPYARDSLVGAGVYALSQEGRARFEEFPQLIADDQFVHSLFDSSERRALTNAEYVSFAPRRTRNMVRRLVRVYAGNAELSEHSATQRGQTTPRSIVRMLQSRPDLLADAAVFLGISLVAKARAATRRRLRRSKSWGRDESSRLPDQPPVVGQSSDRLIRASVGGT